MSCTIKTELELHPRIATKTEIQEESEIEVLRIGRFYRTNAGFPMELHLTQNDCTKSPLRSFGPLCNSRRRLLSGRELFRESTDTTIRHNEIKGDKKRCKNPLNKNRPCYLVEYDESTKEGVIFLGTGTTPKNPHRFVIVHSRGPKDRHLPGTLETNPPYSFPRKKTYLNISHPLRVKFDYLPDAKFPRTRDEGKDYDGHEPPLVAIAKPPTQTSNDGSKPFVIVLNPESEQLFWEKHKEYHINRQEKFQSEDDSDGAGPDDGDGGSSTGGAGSGTDGAEPNTSGAGASTSGAGTSTGGVGGSTSGAGPSTSGVGSNRGVFSSREIEDAPWGRVGDQRIGIDIPLMTEDIYSDSNEEMDCESDEEMNFEEFGITSDAIDAPWGRVGDQRIGIDIPLMTEDIYSDSNEEMDCESDEEFQEVENVANIVKPEFFDEKGITTGSNPSDKDSSWSKTISKPYFVIFVPMENTHVLLDYNHMVGEWRLTPSFGRRRFVGVSIEGLVYEYQFSSEIGESVHEIFNWHTKNSIVLNPPLDERPNFGYSMIGMIVDTFVQPYDFKVIQGSFRSTTIYDSTTHSWTQRLSMPPPGSMGRFHGSANVTSCKGIMFMIDNNNRIVLYDTKKDKWDRIRGPEQRTHLARLHGIGSWDDHVFVSTANLRYDQVFQIWELMGMDNLEWTKFDAMPEDIFIWLIKGDKLNPSFEFDVSYCSENLLIWNRLISPTTRFVLCNLAHKTWEKLELPFPTLTDPESRSLLNPEQLVQIKKTP